VLHNARLTIRLVDRVAELGLRAESLRQARRRLVAAQDEERHRLERDLHDGAQQALVAVVIGAAALRSPVAPSARDELLEVLEIARRDLDQLFNTTRPAVLSRGLSAALTEAADLARRSGLTVQVEQHGVAALDPEVEVAVYYCCLEALQNVMKHADARRAWIEVELQRLVSFSVSDDGRGVDAETIRDSTGGLLQLGARLAVLGGTLTVRERPGGGVVVQGAVPARAGSTALGVAG
jgi:signal transduction histidine kinase